MINRIHGQQAKQSLKVLQYVVRMVAKRTISMDLAALVAAGFLEKFGSRGEGVFYRLARRPPEGAKGAWGKQIDTNNSPGNKMDSTRKSLK